jgi:hypothetical protein
LSSGRVNPQGIFYLRLTLIGRSGNHSGRSVSAMTAHLTPGSGRKDNEAPRGFPRPRTGSNDTAHLDVGSLGVQHGESNPARMLSGVLILVIVATVMALMLAWWLI